MIRFCKLTTIAGLILISPAFGRAERAVQEAMESPSVSYGIFSKNPVPFLGGGFGVSLSKACLSDGTMFVRLKAVGDGVMDLKSISPNGKSVVTFSTEKIVDVSNPEVGSFFLSDSALFLRVTGEEDLKSFRATGRTPQGEVVTSSGKKGSRTYDYIAKFDLDGTYRGATKLDLPFRPLQIAAFSSKGFLVSGMDDVAKEPRLALARWNGQFERYVELPKQSDAKDDAAPAQSRFGTDDRGWAITGIQLTSYDGKILLQRIENPIVYEIALSGEVRTIRLKIPQGFSLYALRAGEGRWIAQVTRRRLDGNGLESATYAFNPETGDVIEKYLFNEPVGLGLACVTKDEILFIKQDEQRNLVVWRAVRNTESQPKTGAIQ